MEHHFNVAVAKELGIAPAIILNHLAFWIAKNKANEKHFYDGCYWTYNSRKAYCEQFPYFTERQIEYALRKLIYGGYVITGNYNKASFDRTLWYAITKKGYCILQNCEMESTNTLNAIDENVKPIPDINTDSKPDKKKERKEAEQETYQEIVSSLVSNKELQEVIFEFIKMRKLIKKPMTNRALKRIILRLKEFAGEDVSLATDILDQSIRNSWQDIYPLKKDYTRKPEAKPRASMERFDPKKVRLSDKVY